MQYDAQTPVQYLEALEPDWRKELLLLVRKIIQTKAPELEEGIQYKMLSYHLGQQTVFHLNAQKHHVGLYVGDIEKIDTNGSLLEGFDKGKGCIRLKKSAITALPKIDIFIDRTVAFWRAGEDISC